MIRLHELRIRMQMNMKEFSRFLDLKYTTYAGYENGMREPGPDFLVMVAKKCGITTDWLLGLSDDDEARLHADTADYEEAINTTRNTLKSQIGTYRKQIGMSIEELSSKSGVPLSTLKKISAGITKAPQVDTLQAIAHALGKTLDDFENPVTIIDYEEAQATLRVNLTEAEFKMLCAYQAADDRAREVALVLLEKFRRQP